MIWKDGAGQRGAAGCISIGIGESTHSLVLLKKGRGAPGQDCLEGSSVGPDVGLAANPADSWVYGLRNGGWVSPIVLE